MSSRKSFRLHRILRAKEPIDTAAQRFEANLPQWRVDTARAAADAALKTTPTLAQSIAVTPQVTS
jgi:hypothetical protein